MNKIYDHGIDDDPHTPSQFRRRWQKIIKKCYAPIPEEGSVEWLIGTVDSDYIDLNIRPDLCLDWHQFSVFRDWCHEQDHHGKKLVVNLANNQSNVYSPVTSRFVDRDLWALLRERVNAYYGHPAHVGVIEKGKRYRATHPRHGKSKHIGYYDTMKAAYEALRAYKSLQILEYADLYEKNGDAKVAKSLRNWQFKTWEELIKRCPLLRTG